MLRVFASLVPQWSGFRKTREKVTKQLQLNNAVVLKKVHFKISALEKVLSGFFLSLAT